MNLKFPDYIFPLIIAMVMAILLKPMVLDGLSPQGVDVIGSKGQLNQIKDFQEKTGKTVLYNPYLFGGMPIYFRIPPKAVSIDTILGILGKFFNNTYLWYIFGACGMFFLLRFMGLSQIPSFFGALGFVLYPHFQALWAEGHFMKFRAVMIIPWVCFSSIWFFRLPNVLSMSLFAIAWGVQIRTQHYQIVFYTALLIFSIGVIYLLQLIKENNIRKILYIKVLTVAGILIALGIASQPLFLAREYLPYSARGAHTINLESPQSNETKSDGVDFGYATNWSTHPAELSTWIIPHFFGGMSGVKYSGDSYPSLKGKTVPGYWGYMPFTQSFEYMGPVILFLLVIGFVYYRKNPYILGMAILGIFLILLSFGKYFESFYSLFFDYLPFFNKFRAPMMSVTITFFLILVIASFGLEFIFSRLEKNDSRNLVGVLGCFVGLGVFCWFLSLGFSFAHSNDSFQAESYRIIKDIRLELFQSDLIRYFLLIGAISALIYTCLKGKISRYVLALSFIGLMAFDLINIYYKKPIRYSDVKKLEKKHFQETEVDKYLQEDTDLFRIFPVGKYFGSNQWSYYHQSIGGYSAVKMNGIQELITNNLYYPLKDKFPINLNIVSMMNVKYLISPNPLTHSSLILIPHISRTSSFVYRFENFLPRGHFVSHVTVLPNPEDRLNYLNSNKFSPVEEAILEESIEILNKSSGQNSAQLEQFEPGYLKWSIQSKAKSLFVISESYYKPGWTAYLNDIEVQVFRANHIHMGVLIPEGDHLLTLEFKPESFVYLASFEKIVLYSLYLFLLFQIGYKYRKKMPYLKSKK